NGLSRLRRGRTSCCLTHMVPQCGHASRFLVAITSTRSFPSACTSCLRIRRPSNSKGTTIPAAWFGSSSVVCWPGITCPPVTWCFCSYQVQRRTSRLLRFLPKSPQRMQSQPSVNQMGENSATLQSSLPYGPEPNTILGATYYLTTGLTDEHMLYSLRGK